MLRRGLSAWWTASGVAAFVLAVAVLFPVLELSCGHHVYEPSCFVNLKMVGIAIVMYSGDYDDLLPRKGPWMDDIQPYLKSEDTLHCPKVIADNMNPQTTSPYGYAMNSAIVGMNDAKFKDPERTIVLFDSANLSRNTIGGRELLPRPTRHNRKVRDWLFVNQEERGNNVAYADTHVKWRPEGHEWLSKE